VRLLKIGVLGTNACYTFAGKASAELETELKSIVSATKEHPMKPTLRPSDIADAERHWQPSTPGLVARGDGKRCRGSGAWLASARPFGARTARCRGWRPGASGRRVMTGQLREESRRAAVAESSLA
jgi:hypothetical protein